MCTHRLPPEIIKDMDRFLENGVPRMDSNQKGAKGTCGYSIQYGVHDITFKTAPLAPPVGFVGMNYAR